MIIISTHVRTLVHNYPPFSISTHVEVIIILKTKDFVNTIEKVLNSCKIKENSKAIFVFLYFLRAPRWISPTKNFYNMKWVSIEMFIFQWFIANHKVPINTVTLIYHLNCVNVFMDELFLPWMDKGIYFTENSQIFIIFHDVWLILSHIDILWNILQIENVFLLNEITNTISFGRSFDLLIW